MSMAEQNANKHDRDREIEFEKQTCYDVCNLTNCFTTIFSQYSHLHLKINLALYKIVSKLGKPVATKTPVKLSYFL